MLRFFKKYHKWLGLVFSFFLIIYSLSGIVLNHRDLLAGTDVSRHLFPKSYSYHNWNLGALRGSEKIGHDSILLYGNMGIWLANDHLKNLRDFSAGLPKGMDNRKIFCVHESEAGNLYLASLRGVFQFNKESKSWKKIPLDTHDERFVDIAGKAGEMFFLSRSHVFKGKDEPNAATFQKIQLKNPAGYEDKTGLFKTIWFIHSGEIYGHWGKLLVDLLGLVFILLSVGGIVYFFMPRKMKKDHKEGKNIDHLKGFHRWNLRWHNRLGYIFIIFLLITSLTGIFLRPPGLILIASGKVSKIPFTTLDTPNSWFDKLRAMEYDSLHNRFLILTDEWAYSIDEQLSKTPEPFDFQPPISIMGVNVFETMGNGNYLVGSFAGLFLWNPVRGLLMDYQAQSAYKPVKTLGPPIKNSSISGYITNGAGHAFYTDYDLGMQPVFRGYEVPEMPQIIGESRISLWNLALEIHTGRYFSFILGAFYILLVPIVGLVTMFILISGFVIWWKRYRKA